MTIATFRELDESEQFEMFSDAVEIGVYDDGFTIKKCRQIDDFYVEYILDTTDDYKMYMICHRDISQLDKYFAHYPPVNLQSLMEP